jgi:hypothetical protein
MFDPNKVATVIDEIYHTMNIQYSLVVFNEVDRFTEAFKVFVKNLETRDFPFIIYGHNTVWSYEVLDADIMSKRMFLVPYQFLGRFLDIWRVNFENINFIVWLSNVSKSVFDTMTPYYGLKFSPNIIRLLVDENHT